MTELDRHDNVAPYRDGDWNALVTTADQVYVADLTGGELLLGVPFLIVQGTIRDGQYMNAVTEQVHPYVSLQVIVGPEDLIGRALARGKVTPEQVAKIQPGESLVFNEAGTGVYRQFLEYLEAKNMVEFPDGPASGKLGESRYDTLPHQWRYPSDSGHDANHLEFNVRLFCPRGLRESHYENEYNKEATTRYFA